MHEEEQARQARRQRITEISQHIEQLSIELNDLLIEETEAQYQYSSNDDQANQEGTSADRPRGATSNRSSGNIDHQQSQSARRATSTSSDNEANQQQYTVGQQVIINNEYQGLRGQIGRITKVTKKQVTLSVPGQAKPVIRSKTNVRTIS